MYFIKKLYRALKVPSARLDPEQSVEAGGTSILREELKFARFVIRQQERFAAGIKRGFITHLKLKKLFENLALALNLLGFGVGTILLAFGNEIGMYIILASFLLLTFTSK